jgi:RNA polymerase sigma-70 factor (ECF subfamily)
MSDTFVHFYEQNVSDVYGYLAYRTGSRVQAERLTQATFERAAREWESLGSDHEGARVWLFSIARQAANGRPGGTGPDDSGLPSDLARALRRLDRSERSAVALRLGGRLVGPQIARVLDVTENTVRRRLSRGLRRLRTELHGVGERGSAGAQLERQDHRDDERGES